MLKSMVFHNRNKDLTTVIGWRRQSRIIVMSITYRMRDKKRRLSFQESNVHNMWGFSLLLSPGLSSTAGDLISSMILPVIFWFSQTNISLIVFIYIYIIYTSPRNLLKSQTVFYSDLPLFGTRRTPNVLDNM